MTDASLIPPSLSAAAITATAGIVIWVISRLYDAWSAHRKTEKDKEKFIRALFAEIDFNTTDMEEFIENPIPENMVINKIMENNDFIPHITDSRHTIFYRSNISDISFSGGYYIADVIFFYGLLERIKGQIDGVYLPSYTIISQQGRANVISRIYEDANLGAKTGRAILDVMELEYSTYKLSRKIRKAPDLQSSAHLENRLEKLSLDLDRVRATHRKAS